MTAVARRSSRVGTAAGAAVTSVVVAVAGLMLAAGPARADTAPLAPATATQATVAGDALPTAQIGPGVVWDQVIVGDTVYVAGEFSTARPAGVAIGGAGEVSRSNLLAYKLSTGALLPWAPAPNGVVRTIAASADGKTIYVGGVFNKIGSVSKVRLAALDAATGAVRTAFTANAASRVNDIAVAGTTVYFGGLFTVVNNTSRTRLAAVNGTTGKLTAWAPTADAEVLALTLPPGAGKVVVGGRFTKLSGVANYGMGAVNSTTGAVLAWKINATVRNAGANSAINALKSDASRVYGSGYTFGAGGNYENAFAAKVADGAIEHVNGCRGDTYDIQPIGEVLYQVGHAHDCSSIGGNPEKPVREWQRAVATTLVKDPGGGLNSVGVMVGQPAPRWLHWTPDLNSGTFTGQDQAAWTIEGTADYLALGGEFPKVNGLAQQGLVRFARKALAPLKEGPRSGQDLVPVIDTTSVPGSVRVTFKASFDRDNQLLKYEVLRGATLATSTVIATTTRTNAWFSREGMSFVDATAAAGSSQTYRIRVTDPDGNTLVGNPTTATVPATGTRTAVKYPNLVIKDGASHYWRFGEASGGIAVDWAGTDQLVLAGGATRGVVGPITGDADRATTFSGLESAPAAGTTLSEGLRTVSIEAWFKTTTKKGGKIVGFGNAAGGMSSSHGQNLYMTDAGKLAFGLYLNKVVAAAITPLSYNNGAWHHVVAVQGAAGLQLYVDGALVASSTTLKTGQWFKGYWRIGGDTLGASWPSTPTSKSFAGSVDEVAIYPRALTAAVAASHYAARTGGA